MDFRSQCLANIETRADGIGLEKITQDRVVQRGTLT